MSNENSANTHYVNDKGVLVLVNPINKKDLEIK